MELSLYKELLLLGVIFVFSVIGGITGIGIATIVIPLLILLGVSLPFAKATALWVNISIMSYSVFRRRRLIKWSLALPLVVSAFLLAPLGAKVSFFIPARVQLLLLATVVLASALLILYLKPKPRVSGLTRFGFIKVGAVVGAVAGFLGGMLGIGGGIIANPILIVLGFDPVEVTTVSALMVLLSSLSGWATYTYFGYFPYKWALPLLIAALGGSYVGNRLSERFSRETLRRVVAYFAIFVSLITYLKAITL